MKPIIGMSCGEDGGRFQGQPPSPQSQSPLNDLLGQHPSPPPPGSGAPSLLGEGTWNLPHHISSLRLPHPTASRSEVDSRDGAHCRARLRARWKQLRSNGGTGQEGDLGAAREARELGVTYSGSEDPTHRGMSLDLPVEAGPDTRSRHNASPVSDVPQRLCSLTPLGVPPPAGEGSAQPGTARSGRLTPPPLISSSSRSSGLRAGELLGSRGLSAPPLLQMPAPWRRGHPHPRGLGLV